MTARIGHGFGSGCSVGWGSTSAEAATKKSAMSAAMTELRLGLTMLNSRIMQVGWFYSKITTDVPKAESAQRKLEKQQGGKKKLRTPGIT